MRILKKIWFQKIGSDPERDHTHPDAERIDLEDEVGPGVSLRATQAAISASDPELRADDESMPDVHRARKNPKAA